MAHQHADINWTCGQVPVSTRFDDPYYSLVDGLAETRHAFPDGNALAGRFRPGFAIVEPGFGSKPHMTRAVLP